MKNILSLKRAALLMFALSFYTIGNTQICIPLPAMDGTPSPSMAPAGWTIWIPSPDLISGLGPWPGGGGYVTYDVDGFSEAGGEMSMMLATAGGFVTEGIQTTLTGLTAGLTYEVSLEWQQATLSNVSNVYAEGRLSVTVEGTETIFTSVGGLDDGWQVATVTFVASGPTSNFQCKGIPTEIPNGLVGYAIVVDDYPCITGLEISVPSVDICVGECADLEAITSGEIGDVTYEWSPGIPDIDANVTVCPDETTIYQVIGTDEDGQVDTTLVTVTVHDLPDVDLGPDAFLASCIADEIILDAENEGSTYEWQDGSTDQMLLITEPGLYWVEVTNEFGCQSSDTIEIELADSPDLSAKIEFIINGFSSEDGATGGCILNPVEFNDISFVGDPGVIVEWDWNFGDGGSSTEENPEHSYGTEGTYTITLTVTTDEGCTDTYSIDIIMTSSLNLEFLINEPTCYGFSDGSITVNVAGGGDELTFIITDSDGNEMNEGNSNTANTLNKGWYYFDVSDESSCDAIDSVFLDEPGELDIDITVTDPLCFGFKTAWARVDSVYNTTGDYDGVSYIWNPNPAGVGGEGADSTYNMGAGDYTLTINDDNGCSKVFDFEVNQPDSLYFSEFGFEPAYCRLHEYQSGNGVVFGAASGGTPDFDYLWTNVATGETINNTTWGGRNPGNYKLTVIDANGCILERTIFLDSLNPIADFSVISDQLNGDLKGTAPVEVSFGNLSQNFANPFNPTADTTFFWNLDRPTADWQVSHDYFEILDTTYTAKGQTYTVDVCLVALNKNGCTDTACKVITIYEPIVFTQINIFTPNGDGINDVFSFDFRASSITDFSCVIVNRWGIVVHEMDNITDAWDGTDKSGSPCNDGTYFYTYSATADDGTKLSGQGNVSLVGGK